MKEIYRIKQLEQNNTKENKKENTEELKVHKKVIEFNGKFLTIYI